MSFYAGGELLCLYLCKTLQEMGFQVYLASNEFDPSKVERIYGLGYIMEACTYIRIPEFRPVAPRLMALQKLCYAIRIWPFLKGFKADIVFCTQSSSFILTAQRIYHFVYSIQDLFDYPPGSGPGIPPTTKGPWKTVYLSMVRLARRFLWETRFREPTGYLAVGSQVLLDLKNRGYHNSSLIFPPCQTHFKPKFPKKRQVLQAARLIPDKRLELFFQIAEALPEYPFYLLGRGLPIQEKMFPKYQEQLLSHIPENVAYLETVTRERPELLEESMIYLYTGKERGVVMTVAEAMAAGCFPLSPRNVGAADIIQAAGIGFLYNTPREAALEIRKVLESEYSESMTHSIAEKAQLFSLDAFEKQIRSIINDP